MGETDTIERAEVVAGRRRGGSVLNAFIVQRPGGGAHLYVRVSWVQGRAYFRIRTWRNNYGDRVFKSLDAAVRYCRGLGVDGKIPVYLENDPELAQYASFGGGDHRAHFDVRLSGDELG